MGPTWGPPGSCQPQRGPMLAQWTLLSGLASRVGNRMLVWEMAKRVTSQIAKFLGPTWGPPGSYRPQMGPMLAPGTLLSGMSTLVMAWYWTGDKSLPETIMIRFIDAHIHHQVSMIYDLYRLCWRSFAGIFHVFQTNLIKLIMHLSYIFPDSKVHGAQMGPIWGRQDPGGPHVGPMNFAIWAYNIPLKTEMCIFLFSLVYCGIWDRCIVGFMSSVIKRSELYLKIIDQWSNSTPCPRSVFGCSK